MPKKVFIASNAFKESLSSSEVSDAILQGFKKYHPDWAYEALSIADGGDGSLDCIQSHANDKLECMTSIVTGPLGEPVKAQWLKQSNKAYIEVAEVVGLKLISPQSRNPLKASSYGVGELIRLALHDSCTDITLFLGGSATVDGGMGALEALGFQFRDNQMNVLSGNGQNLKKIHHIEPVKFDSSIRFKVISDVNIPLLGPSGAVSMFASQKGATHEMLPVLKDGLINWSKQMSNAFNSNWSDVEGYGSAGGMGFGFSVGLQTTIMLGVEYFSDLLNLDLKVAHADLLITGEGQIDEQTVFNKLPHKLIELAKLYRKPIIVICGQNRLKQFDNDPSVIIFDTLPYILEGDEWQSNASHWVTSTSEQIAKCLGVI